MTRGQALLGAVCVVSGCWTEEPRIDDTFTEEEWAVLQTFAAPGPDLCPPAFDDDLVKCTAAAELGKALFFDAAISGPVTVDDPFAPGALGEVGTLACASCHDPKQFFIDTRSRPSNLAFGATGRLRHNALSVVNMSLKSVVARQNCEPPDADELECGLVFSWTGKYQSSGEVLLIAGPKAMNTDAARISNALRANGNYLMSYGGLFGALPPTCDLVAGSCACPQDEMCHSAETVFGNVSLVFDTYLRQLNSVGSPFDRYIAQPADDYRTPPVDGFGDAERRGLAIFLGKGMCVDCHGGPLLSDLRFHNTGVAQTGPNVIAIDGGFGAEVFGDFEVPDERLGEFLTPPLRHVAETAPYMHAGQLATLGEVIAFYRRGGDAQGFVGRKDPRIEPLEITDDEANDLEVFLGSLTGETAGFELWTPEGE